MAQKEKDKPMLVHLVVEVDETYFPSSASENTGLCMALQNLKGVVSAKTSSLSAVTRWLEVIQERTSKMLVELKTSADPKPESLNDEPSREETDESSLPARDE